MMAKKKGWAMKEEKLRNQARKKRKWEREKPHGGYPTQRSKGPKMIAEKLKNKNRKRRTPKAPTYRP